MPSVKASLRWLIIRVIIIMNSCISYRVIRISEKWSTKGIFHRSSILLGGKAPCSSKIILRTRAADCRISPVTIQIEFNLSFSIPVSFQCRQSHIGSHILTFASHSIQNHIILPFLSNPLPAPLRMKIPRVRRKLLCQAVIHLIKKGGNILITLIFQCDSGFFPKWHGKIHIKSPRRIHRNRKGIYRIGNSKTAAKKISQRAFHRRRLFSIPVHTKHQIPEYKPVSVTYPVCNCDPDMLQDTRALYLS